MVYTPPSRETETQTLEEMKEALNRAVRIPSPTRASPKTTVPRSPCTSLYGNWRPTTGTENWKSASGKPATKKPAPKAAQEAANKVRAPRGRPPAERKPAVRQDLLPEFVARAAKVLLLNNGQMDSNLFGQQWKMLHRTAPLSSFKNHKGVAVHQMMRENSEYFTVSETNRNKVKMFSMLEDNVNSYLKRCGATVSISELEGEKELVKLSNGLLPEDGVETDKSEEAAAALAKQEDDTPPIETPHLDPAMSIIDESWSEVPGQGRARRGFDRRSVAPRIKVKSRSVAEPFEDVAAAPRSHPEDALENPTVALYNGWAVDGRDVVMEVSNEGPVSEFLESAVEEAPASLKAVDLGCGNGWAARKIMDLAPEAEVVAVDAAAGMVERAQTIDEEGVADYVVADVGDWAPSTGDKSLDLVVAVELLHLVDDPGAVLKRAAGWLKPGGKLVVSLECYKENRLSRSWSTDLGIPMTVMAQKKWVEMVEEAGLKAVSATRSQPKGPWPGMLVLQGTK
jgi:SAM-dependent methyltransferase